FSWLSLLLLFSNTRLPSLGTLFPYTPLFRSARPVEVPVPEPEDPDVEPRDVPEQRLGAPPGLGLALAGGRRHHPCHRAAGPSRHQREARARGAALDFVGVIA